MIALTTRDANILVEWEGKSLSVWLVPKDAPDAKIQLTEHQVENISRAIGKVRSEKWLISQEAGT